MKCFTSWFIVGEILKGGSNIKARLLTVTHSMQGKNTGIQGEKSSVVVGPQEELGKKSARWGAGS